MSAPVDKLWPKEGNIFKTKADVLLVCQLAALKAGFSHLEIRSDYPSGRVDSCAIRCAAEFNGKRCLLLLVMLEMVDRGDLKLGWRITTVRADNLEAARHPNHIGQSESLSLPRSAFSLKVGDVVAEGVQMHLLEAALQVSARQQNRHLIKYYGSSSLYKEPGYRLHFACSRGHAGCSFFIRFGQTAGGAFRCMQVDPMHNCGKGAVEPPGSKLSSRMLAFPAITLVRGVIGEPQVIKPEAKVRAARKGLLEDSDTENSDDDIAKIPDTPLPAKLPPPLADIYPVAPSSAPSATPSSSTAFLPAKHQPKTDTGDRQKKKRSKASKVNQPALAETKEQRRERTREEKQPSGLAKATILNPRPTSNPRAAESSSPARSSSPQLKTYRHHGKQETEHERKARRKREREERTGVIESHVQRQERRKGKAEKQRRDLDGEEEIVARTVIEIDSDIEIVSSNPARPSAQAPASVKKPDPRPSSSSAAPSSVFANAEKPVKIFMYKGKIETKSERKVRRKKERELKTGVVESHEERKVRRQMKKLKEQKRAAERAVKRGSKS